MSATIIPSFYGIPIVTSLPTVHYDERGRLMKYSETEVQRREREAFIQKKQLQQKISDWMGDLPHQINKATPRRAAWAFGDPLDIGFISMSMNEPSSISPVLDISKEAYYPQDEPYIVYSTHSIPRKGLKSPTGFNRGHRRNSSSLSSIPEED